MPKQRDTGCTPVIEGIVSACSCFYGPAATQTATVPSIITSYTAVSTATTFIFSALEKTVARMISHVLIILPKDKWYHIHFLSVEIVYPSQPKLTNGTSELPKSTCLRIRTIRHLWFSRYLKRHFRIVRSSSKPNQQQHFSWHRRQSV
jgi:hypothetical protein